MRRNSLRFICLFLILTLAGCNGSNTEPKPTQSQEERSADYIPDPVRTSGFDISGGYIAKLAFTNSYELCDMAGNADTVIAGGECRLAEVKHNGSTYSTYAYVKSAKENQAMALDLYKYSDNKALRDALQSGYTIEVAIEYTEDIDDGLYAVFSSTQNGMFGLWCDGGYFRFEQFDSDYRFVLSKEKVKKGELYHIAGVYDSGEKMIELYVNGEKQGKAEVSGLTFGESPFIYCIGADIGYGKSMTDYANLPSVYTLCAIHASAMTESEVKDLYETMVRDIASPTTYEKSEDLFSIRSVNIKGEAAKGKTIGINGTLVNDSDEDRKFKLHLSHPLLSAECGHDDQEIVVAAKSSEAFTYELKINDGGSMLLSIDLLSRGDFVLASSTLSVTASGTGYYIGDAHTHSTLSDGKASLTDNFKAAFDKGQSWMIATDHNYDVTKKASAVKPEGFIALTGNEITTEVGHMLEYGVAKSHTGGYTGGMWDIMAAYRPSAQEWQAVIDDIVGQGGACYLAHPMDYSGSGSWLWPGVGKDPSKVSVYRNFTGIEVYNADSDANGYNPRATQMAMEFWDRYNLKGEARYYGISNTDGHADTTVATAANALLMDEFDEENILKSLKTGHFYGTNGPELRFSIDGIGMGDVLTRPSSGKATLNVAVADRASYILKVVLYTYSITGNIDESYKSRTEEVLFDSTKQGNTSIFNLSKEINIESGEFCRIEVYTQASLYGDYVNRGGFAFSNPIWIS